MSAEAEATFYVATDGDDAWSGTLSASTGEDGPFATLHRARDAVRQLKGEGCTDPITVMVRGGKYYLERTLELTRVDSGTSESPVTYSAYPGETPVISGGRPITGWEAHDGRILKTALPVTRGGAWSFRQLFLDGQRMVRSRYPNLDPGDELWNGKWANSEAPDDEPERTDPAITWKERGAFPRDWAKPTQGEVFLLPSATTWGDSCMIRIRSIDRERGLIRLAHGLRDFDRNPIFYPAGSQRREPCRFVVENLLEELDQPGEWCLDGEDGVLYFWPPDDKLDGEVVAPLLKCLVHMRGTSHVRFSGFTFTETRAGEPSSHYADVEGLGAMSPQQGWEYSGETIYMNLCSHCRIENNTITGVGGNGIYLRHHNENNVIRGNEIRDAGANGIVLGGGRHSIYVCTGGTPGAPHPVSNEVSDNVIHHTGLYDTYAAGVFLGLGDQNRIIHNWIHDVPHHGINLGCSRYGRQYVEYNRIERACAVTSDNGAINCWHEEPIEDEPPGHLIRYNLVADTGNPGSGGTFAIYLDNWASNCLVQGNIVVNTLPDARGVSIVAKGKNNTIDNNILMNAGSCHIWIMVHCCYPEFATTVTRNVMVDPSGQMECYFNVADLDHMWKVISESDHNLYFTTGDDNPVIAKAVPRSDDFGAMYGNSERLEMMRMGEWRRAYGRDEDVYDVNSVTADPGFVDLEGGDYRLRPDSPALALGFSPIPVDRIGPRAKVSE